MNRFCIFILFILFVYLTSFSCSAVNNSLDKINISEQVSNKNTLLLGSWTIITYEINKAHTSCYSCSIIQFLKDGTGEIHTPTNHKYKFKYTLTDRQLLFNSKKAKLSDLLCKNTEFHYEIKEEGGFLHLILSSKTKDCKLVLTKNK